MRKNDPRFAINAGWTAVVTQRGWRHFRIVDRRWCGKELEVELMAACDREVRFWVVARDLLNPQSYISGWRDPLEIKTN